MPETETAKSKTINAEIVRAIVRAAIDTGASCQKAGSFVAVEPGKPMRSVYDVMFDQAMNALKNDQTETTGWRFRK